MASPVVVSRIQNRRGLQSQFDNLYPLPYDSLPGATSVGQVVTVNDTTGITPNAPVLVTSGVGLFQPGTFVASIDSATEFTVSAVPIVDLSGGLSVVSIPKYNGIWGANIISYPNILMPGELALCTDTRKVFMGNLNGEYVEILTFEDNNDLLLEPITLSLPNTQIPGDPPVFAPTGLFYKSTPFLNVLYDVTDNTLSDWNSEGIVFSKNGELKITCAAGNVSLTDTGTEVDSFGIFLSLIAVYNSPNIEIHYSHDYVSNNLIFNSSTIRWEPFPI